MTKPTDGMRITQDTVFEPGVYDVPNGITIAADHITVDGNGAVLVGSGRTGQGIRVVNQSGVTLRNIQAREFHHGILAQNCHALTLSGCQVTSTAETPPNTIFLDIWLPFEKAYGGGIVLVDCTEVRVLENDLQHQMNGLLAYGCGRLEVRRNNASYCSGWGFHLYETCDSLYEDNCADYCCRYEPRGERRGHMGADAAGFLIIRSSSRNVFRRNLARLGGDGFFLAGLSPAFEPVPCNDNLFEENDGSYSPNIAFEATFSSGNRYINNYANFCNYGFWLGFSRDGLIQGNQVIGSHQAGIATEMGFNFQVSGNTFRDNNHGILLWSKHIPEFSTAVPENVNSYQWRIEGNQFDHNNKAIRIAANQDHGIRPYKVPAGEDPITFCRPHDHTIHRNTFVNNQVAIETFHTDRTIAEENSFEGNIEGNLSQA